MVGFDDIIVFDFGYNRYNCIKFTLFEKLFNIHRMSVKFGSVEYTVVWSIGA